ncbi:unnamed protein product [Sphenostylis stenocarpa]|uniref:Uncharacterized protein n=1 Tax=Sphenostylis stenocarpa TaxID=92480 RepID=A0AA86S9R0_9FABA|nr:unnamed protein product [Sphenostylis stenocarpa]
MVWSSLLEMAGDIDMNYIFSIIFIHPRTLHQAMQLKHTTIPGTGLCQIHTWDQLSFQMSFVQQPPPIEVTQQAYSTHSGHGSVGPVIAVLAVITVLGVIAGMIGRLCSGRRVMGHGEYDVETWVETKCSSCVDGRIAVPPPPPPPEPVVVEDAPPVEVHQEMKEQQQHSRQNSHAQSDS